MKYPAVLSPLPVAILMAGGLALGSSSASAQAPLVDGLGGVAGYGTSCLGKSDDGSSASIDLTPYFPDGLRFFDRTHTSVFVNVNGNVTFGAPQACYTPEPFPIADQPMIAPYWGDVDIRPLVSDFILRECDGPEGTVSCDAMTVATCHNPTDNGVWYHLEEGRMTVTWHRVGYYQCRDDKRMNFQLILTAAPGCGGAGDFDVEFRYNECGWTTGDASGGSSGFGGTPAQAGFDAGNLADFVEIMGSRSASIHTTLCTMSNVGETGVWRFQIRSGTVICPDAGEVCDTGGVGVCAAGRTNCEADGTVCRPEVESSDERCDALDNDCDGTTDEGEALCGAAAVCVRGVCVEGCFEGGCPEGQMCVGATCVDPACMDIECPEGQRCVGGSCVGACDGVVCPDGLSCRGGRCVDPCAGAVCDDCTVCDDGACIASCEFSPCGDGETCLESGRCVDTRCADVTCAAGESCREGTCVDACEGVTCPFGETCETGRCVGGPEPVDAGPPPSDGGVLADGGTGVDAGTADAGIGMFDAGGADAGRFVPGPGASCACRAGQSRRTASPLWLAALGVVLFARRRR
ncbi:MAG: nidogen-like domain-containing protein [Sandaracinaceae bacterium]